MTYRKALGASLTGKVPTETVADLSPCWALVTLYAVAAVIAELLGNNEVFWGLVASEILLTSALLHIQALRVMKGKRR